MTGPGSGRLLISQILPEAPYFHGPLAAEVLRRRPAGLRLALHPAEATTDGDGQPHMEPPAASWTSDPSGEWGPLSPMSFIALWAQGVRSVTGMRVELDLGDAAALAACPFVMLHPSGFFQAVRYDAPSRGFVRRVLYPVG